MFQKSLFTLAVVFVLSFATSALADYSAAIEDLPIMPTMVEDRSKIVVFDTPDGRIVETAMFTPAHRRQVLTYYYSALPPLGWKIVDGSYNVYKRNKEVLVIEVYQQPGAKVHQVQFKIAPDTEK